MSRSITQGNWRVSKSGTCVDLPHGGQIRQIKNGQDDIANARAISTVPQLLMLYCLITKISENTLASNSTDPISISGLDAVRMRELLYLIKEKIGGAK